MLKWFKKRKKLVFEASVHGGGINDSGEYMLMLKVTKGDLYQLSRWKQLQTKIEIKALDTEDLARLDIGSEDTNTQG